jgi:hypothetical protein
MAYEFARRNFLLIPLCTSQCLSFEFVYVVGTSLFFQWFHLIFHKSRNGWRELCVSVCVREREWLKEKSGNAAWNMGSTLSHSFAYVYVMNECLRFIEKSTNTSIGRNWENHPIIAHAARNCIGGWLVDDSGGWERERV